MQRMVPHQHTVMVPRTKMVPVGVDSIYTHCVKTLYLYLLACMIECNIHCGLRLSAFFPSSTFELVHVVRHLFIFYLAFCERK